MIGQCFDSMIMVYVSIDRVVITADQNLESKSWKLLATVFEPP